MQKLFKQMPPVMQIGILQSRYNEVSALSEMIEQYTDNTPEIELTEEDTAIFDQAKAILDRIQVDILKQVREIYSPKITVQVNKKKPLPATISRVY